MAGGLKRIVAKAMGRMCPRLWLERELRSRPNHFEPEMWLVAALCARNRVAVDIGANNGTYSYYMGRFAGQVVAFEPNRDLWPHLRRLLGRGVRLEGVALSAATGKVTMRIDTENTGVSTIEAGNKMSCSEHPEAVVEREVAVCTLDSYGFSGVSFIKIDVEGHEEAVIAGAKETLRRERPALLIESEDRHKAGAPRRLAETLAGLGYRGYYLRGGRLMDFATLTAEMTDAAQLGRGGEYINNFLFVHESDADAVERVQRVLTVR